MLIASPEAAAAMPSRTRRTVRPWLPIDVSTKPERKCPASLPSMTQPLSSRMLPRGGEPRDGMGRAVFQDVIRAHRLHRAREPDHVPRRQ